MSIRKQAGVMLATLLLAGAALAQAPDIKPVRIRGDIVSLKGDDGASPQRRHRLN